MEPVIYTKQIQSCFKDIIDLSDIIYIIINYISDECKDCESLTAIKSYNNMYLCSHHYYERVTNPICYYDKCNSIAYFMKFDTHELVCHHHSVGLLTVLLKMCDECGYNIAWYMNGYNIICSSCNDKMVTSNSVITFVDRRINVMGITCACGDCSQRTDKLFVCSCGYKRCLHCYGANAWHSVICFEDKSKEMIICNRCCGNYTIINNKKLHNLRSLHNCTNYNCTNSGDLFKYDDGNMYCLNHCSFANRSVIIRYNRRICERINCLAMFNNTYCRKHHNGQASGVINVISSYVTPESSPSKINYGLMISGIILILILVSR